MKANISKAAAKVTAKAAARRGRLLRIKRGPGRVVDVAEIAAARRALGNAARSGRIVTRSFRLRFARVAAFAAARRRRLAQHAPESIGG